MERSKFQDLADKYDANGRQLGEAYKMSALTNESRYEVEVMDIEHEQRKLIGAMIAEVRESGADGMTALVPDGAITVTAEGGFEFEMSNPTHLFAI